MKLRRILILVLALMMVLPLLAACNDGKNPDEETTPAQNDNQETDPDEIGEKDENPNIAPIDGGNREFHFLVRNPGAEFTFKYSEILDDETGDTVNQAVIDRNYFIEEKYNIIITATTNTPAGMINLLDQDQRAGDTTYDVVMPMVENAFLASCRGLLTEWDKIPYVDLDKSYWRKDVYNASSVCGFNFYAIGDQNISAYNTVPVMFFNKEMREDLVLDNPYDLVENGTWTQAKMQEMAAVATVDGNGDGMGEQGTLTDDVYGLVSGPFVWQPFFYASGMTLLAKDESDIPSLSAITDNSELTIDIIKNITTLMNDNTRAGLTTKIGYSGKGFDKFKEDGCLFYVECIYGQFQITDMESEYGILPIPVWEEGAEFTSYIHASHSSVSAIPLHVKDLNLSGAILEDMAYYSQKDIVPVFYEDLIKLRGVRDSESYEMLDIIFGNIILDIGQVMKGASLQIDNHVRAIVGDNTPDVIASTFQDNKEKYKAVIDELVLYFAQEGAKQYQ